jgi:hypothetical protein
MATPLTLDTARSGDGQLVLTARGDIDWSSTSAPSSTSTDVLFPYVEQIRVIAHPFVVRLLDISGFSELASVEPAPPPVQT